MYVFKYDEVLKTGYNIQTFKMTVKTIAKRHGLYATFMPKPKYGINGSGMHVNMSLAKDGNLYKHLKKEELLEKLKQLKIDEENNTDVFKKWKDLLRNEKSEK